LSSAQLGAHLTGEGTAFAVWAPRASSVSVLGDFNDWNGDAMQLDPDTGIWSTFVDQANEGQFYKYAIDGSLRADPYAFAAELPPGAASVISCSHHIWDEPAWPGTGPARPVPGRALSIYEVHLGSWRRDGRGRPDFEQLAAYVAELGFTHVELLPVMAHPFAGSWGYQVTSYFAPSARYGSPDELKLLIERMHQHGVGVILDWVPAHFPDDPWALVRFDGEPLYESGDATQWNTFAFDYARPEVREFLISSALFWLREFHADGLRVDAVSSMLPDGAAFLSELTSCVRAQAPAAVVIAEESTSWPGVTDENGLGFDFKWNMGWVSDTLDYFRTEPAQRAPQHGKLTFGLMYAFDEQFVLPLSHDEVVQARGSLYGQMPGDHREKLANLRLLYAYAWAHPGKKLLFMGGELAQTTAWNADSALPWKLAERPAHAGLQRFVRELNRVYRSEPALWELDGEEGGFAWLDVDGAERGVIAFARYAKEPKRVLVFAANFSSSALTDYQLGLPQGDRWRVVIASDESSPAKLPTLRRPVNNQPFSTTLDLPPVSAVWLVPDAQAPLTALSS